MAAPSVEDPDFYVVDDCYGAQRRIFVEPKMTAVSAEWLLELGAHLRDHRGWDVLVSFGEGIAAAVRADAIEIGGLDSPSADLGTLVEDIRKHVFERGADKQATKSRRLATVSQLVPSAWATRDSLALVAHFPTTAHGSAGDSVWLLHRAARSLLDLDEYRLEPDAVRPLVYRARQSGELLEYEAGAHDGTLALLAEWTLRSKGQPVQGATKLRVRKGTQTWEFDLRFN